MYKIVEFNHLIIKNYIDKQKEKNIDYTPYILDATCGTGSDSLYLLKTINKKGKLDSYDIQSKAILSCLSLLQENSFNDITLYLNSHENINPSKYDIITFNLGYLPGGNKNITTMCTSTINTIKKIIPYFLEKEMLLTIACYKGHDEGLKETIEVDEYLKSLDSKKYLVCKYENYNRPSSPLLYTVTNNHLK